jgi:hypothetical protein
MSLLRASLTYQKDLLKLTIFSNRDIDEHDALAKENPII